jgi:FKBP-type peptidyl-prolyl cis-trans isomerase FkpA
MMSPTRTSYISVACRLLVLVLLTLPVVTLTAGCGSSDQTVPTAPTPPQGPPDLQITDLTVGTGDALTAGNQQGTFIYTVWAYDPAGTDSKGTALMTGTLQVRIGVTNIIPGVSQGVTGMQSGGSRRVIVPPSLAYGATGNGSIAPNSWLVFEFQLLEVRDCTLVACQS